MNSDHVISRLRIQPDQDLITARVPAMRRYVSSIRSLTTSLAMQSELTVDEIEDIQMATDEACALLLPQVDPSAQWLDLRFGTAPWRFNAEVSVAVTDPAVAAAELDRGSLSWTVLSALCDEVDVVTDGQTLTICFAKSRQVTQS